MFRDRAQAVARAGLVPGAGAGIERVAVDREEADAGRFVEDLLRPVAVVDVEVDDQDPAQLEASQGIGGGDGDVAVDAEPHPRRGPGVVSGRTDEAERAPVRLRHDVGDGLDGRPGGQPGRQARAGQEPGVRVEHPAALGLEVEDLGEIVGRVDAGQLLEGRLADRDARAGVVIAGPLELAEDRLEPLGTFRMRRRASDGRSSGGR